MFDIASSELLVVAIVALLVVGPKDLPKLMRTVGHWVRRARMMTGQLRAGFDQMMQEAEFQEERERIMKMYPNPAPEPPAAPSGAPAPQYSEAVQTFSAGPLPPTARPDETVNAPESAADQQTEAVTGRAAGDRPAEDQPVNDKNVAAEQRS